MRKTEEKGNHVNLTTHMIVDAGDRAFDIAVDSVEKRLVSRVGRRQQGGWWER
jgi:hypothetical protein